MYACADATRLSVNEFLSDQKRSDIVSSISLTAFNTACRIVYSGAKPKTAALLSEKNYAPHGMTALHDAVGMTIETLVASVPKKHRVLCCIITDGQENASKEYSLARVRQLIEKLQKGKLWTVVYIGANQDAWFVGKGMGIPAGNAINYSATPAGTQAAVGGLICNTMSYSTSTAGSTRAFWRGAKPK
jgi:hypothetical protein